jgi:hypothetical protein
MEKGPRIEERYFREHMLRDAGGGVQRECFPDGLYLIFSDVVGVKELSGGIGAIDLEAFVRARKLLDEAKIVKGGGHGEEFGVEAQVPLTALLSREQVDADRPVKEQISGMLAQYVCRLSREQRIGNDNGMIQIWRVIVRPFRVDCAARRCLKARERNGVGLMQKIQIRKTKDGRAGARDSQNLKW